MEILKIQIENWHSEVKVGGDSIPYTYLKRWLWEFEERQKLNNHDGLWKKQFYQVSEMYQEEVNKLKNEIKGWQHLAKNNNHWFTVDDPVPRDDRNILAANRNVSDVPFLAYYDEDSGEFLALDTMKATALSITHWAELPKLPEE